jgi:hypothetical protein
VKKIVLPPTEDGYYRFGELPAIIAEALHPDENYPDDYIMSVVIWRDDGTEHGQYIELTPPAGQRATSLESALLWAQSSVELTDEDKAHPDRCKWVCWRWHEQRRPESERNYLSDGSLVVWSEETQNAVMRAVSRASESNWYKDRLTNAANLHPDDKGHLCVVDGFRNELTFKQGAALGRGWVHIDELNRWGATLRPTSVFKTVDTCLVFVVSARPICVPPELLALAPETSIRIKYRLGLMSGEGIGTAMGYREEIEERMARQAEGLFTVDEAAQVLADSRDGKTGPKWEEDMRNAHRAGVLAIRAADSQQPMRPYAPTDLKNIPSLWTVEQTSLNSVSDLVLVSDIDAWLAAQGVGYRFPRLATDGDATPDTASSIDFALLASPEQLIKAFGAFTGMDKSWFSNITDKPKLLKARKHEGVGGKNYAPPWFCPFEVMLWLVDKKRKVGRPMTREAGWRMLRQHWPNVYDKNLALSPLED